MLWQMRVAPYWIAVAANVAWLISLFAIGPQLEVTLAVVAVNLTMIAYGVLFFVALGTRRLLLVLNARKATTLAV